MSRLYDLQKFCRAERGWLLETIEALVRLESPSDDKAAVDRCGHELAARLEAIGGRVTRIPQRDRGDHLRAEFEPASPGTPEPATPGTLEPATPGTFEPANPGTREPANPRTREPRILMLGHFDTVWPVGTLARMPVTAAAGRLHGPGVFDMKAGIAIAMLATRALIASGLSRRIVMLWTTDEEVGSGTSRLLIEEEARRSGAVLVFEPSLPGGALKTSRKGCGEYEIVVRGVAAHAGVDPTRGASAIHELARQIVRIEQVQDLQRGVSVNVGRVSGGTRTNVIAEEARAVVDVRAPTAADARHIDGALRALAPVDPRTTVTVEGGIDRPPLERSDGVVRLYRVAQAVAAELGIELTEGATGGGSDGNFTAAIGVSTLDGLGAIGDGAHALHEHVDVEALPGRAALVAGLVARVE